MKGIIVDCLACLVKERFGQAQWERILGLAGVKPGKIFFATEDVPDRAALQIIDKTCSVLGLDRQQAADAFGDYWVNTFAPKIYMIHFSKATTAREFLLRMDDVHQSVTRKMANARPPRFEYEWKTEKLLVMTYKSDRGLVELVVGLVRGVAKYYGEDLRVSRLNDYQVQVAFP
jgi:hypothetical protein